MTQKYDYLVYIGRFQPLTLAHMHVINIAKQFTEKLIILVGSSGEPRTVTNPFTFEERKEWIVRHLGRNDKNIFVEPIYDYPYNDNKWVGGVQKTVEAITGGNGRIGVVGHNKDASSFYLNLFPKWGNINVKSITDKNYNIISATDVRNAFFNDKAKYGMPSDGDIDVSDMVKLNIYEDINDFIHNTDEGKWLIEENKSYVDYKAIWENLKGVPEWVKKPIFVTCDAVVVQSGHVLLIQRKDFPGKGKWALPGGFLNNYERIKDGIVRELREETQLKVPEGVIKGSIKHIHVFDNPNRSMRGRIVTHAAYIDLGNFPELPHVKGADDADKAKWVAFKDVKRDMMFDDHAHIIDFFVSIL